MIQIIEHSLIHTTGLTHSLDDLICNLPFPRLTPYDFRGGTSHLIPIAFWDNPKYTLIFLNISPCVIVSPLSLLLPHYSKIFYPHSQL